MSLSGTSCPSLRTRSATRATQTSAESTKTNTIAISNPCLAALVMLLRNERPDSVDSTTQGCVLEMNRSMVWMNCLPASIRTDSGATGSRDAAISSAPTYGAPSAIAYWTATVVFPDPFGPPTIRSRGLSTNQLAIPSFELVNGDVTRLERTGHCKPKKCFSGLVVQPMFWL